MADGLRYVVVLRHIGAEQEERSRFERFGIEIIHFYPDRVFVYRNLEFDSGIFQEAVLFFRPGHRKGLILVTAWS